MEIDHHVASEITQKFPQLAGSNQTEDCKEALLSQRWKALT